MSIRVSLSVINAMGFTSWTESRRWDSFRGFVPWIQTVGTEMLWFKNWGNCELHGRIMAIGNSDSRSGSLSKVLQLFYVWLSDRLLRITRSVVWSAPAQLLLMVYQRKIEKRLYVHNKEERLPWRNEVDDRQLSGTKARQRLLWGLKCSNLTDRWAVRGLLSFTSEYIRSPLWCFFKILNFEPANNCSSEYIGPGLQFYLIIRRFRGSASNIHDSSIRVVVKVWSNTLKRQISQQSEAFLVRLPEPSPSKLPALAAPFQHNLHVPTSKTLHRLSKTIIFETFPLVPSNKVTQKAS
jgi:hypothetical protein